ncbi:class I SAM-dependent methyltransferase [Goodfellowiella coeruleoviolacea]|uniref:Pimeloyl-CoA biosynthesis protein BioC n=1 Tax=Goodfellowiella coeruleoviolacea TaxID=334858 RepID=A0AAE3GK50_9PSEU|nr:class I SAM-dependent methyltransferase [Goodfellowiella coeruleoviolacea]MCP2169068.1 pimeloyl-CoA biosynthesis protein BioC [Goodfellowiella coeruleoviolacea]
MSEDTPLAVGADWEEQARNWIAWARKPDLDSYWRYRAEFLEFLPAPGRATLDLGCGEGRVSRDLAELGHHVVGVDAARTLVAAARQAHPAGDYRLADAADLPFPAERFDLVVAYNSLMDVADMPGAVRESARVLVPGGRLCLAVTHPMTEAGRFDGTGPNARLVIEGTYFDRRRFEDEAERDGMRMVFRGWAYPLSAYSQALEAAGLLIESLREPVAVAASGVPYRLPYHLWIRAIRPATTPAAPTTPTAPTAP